MEKDKLTPTEKTVSILKALSEKPYELKVADVSNITRMNRTTVHRILNELLHEGWVIQDKESKKFKIGPMAYHVGSVYQSNNNYQEKIFEILTVLTEKSKESIGYAVREGDKVISIFEIEIYRPYKLLYLPGQFYPMNRGCYGKCLMAYHDEGIVQKLLSESKFEKVCPNTLTEPKEILNEYKKIREQGYVVSDEEVAPYVVGVGVPVFNVKGIVEACLAVSLLKGPSFNEEKICEFVRILKEGAEEISKYLP